jgi:hypothetical protein
MRTLIVLLAIACLVNLVSPAFAKGGHVGAGHSSSHTRHR